MVGWVLLLLGNCALLALLLWDPPSSRTGIVLIIAVVLNCVTAAFWIARKGRCKSSEAVRHGLDKHGQE